MPRPHQWTISVGWSLFWAFSAVVLLTFVGVRSVEQEVAQRRERDRFRMVVEGALDHTEAALARRLEPAARVLGEAQQWLRLGLVERDDDAALVALFVPQLNQLAQVHALTISDPRGFELLLTRWTGAPHGAWVTREVRRDAWGARAEWSLWDGEGRSRLRRWEEAADHDPRQRPWHTGPLALNQARFGDPASPAPVGPFHWTEVGAFAPEAAGVTASVAAREPGGDVVVLAYAVLLSNLGEESRALRPTPDGAALLLTEDGRAVALPRGLQRSAGPRTALLKPLAEVGPPHLAAGARAFAGRGAAGNGAARIETDQGAWWFGFRPFPVGERGRLWLAVAIPEPDLVLAADTSALAAVGAAAIALALGLTFVLSRLFARPLAALVAQSEQIGALDLASDQPDPAPSRLTEVARLSRALAATRQDLARHVEDRQRAEEEKRETEAKYRRLIENMPQSYFFYAHGPDGVFTYLSPSITSVLGHSVEEFMTHFSTYFTDDPVNEAATRATERSLEGVQQPPYEVEILAKDGVARRLEVLEVPVFDDAGRATAVEGIAHDVTERRAFEGALKHAKERAEVADRTKSDFLANMSHEVRTPLHAILGFAELLAHGALDAQQRDYVDQVLHSGRALLTLVNEVLDFSKVESGRLELEAAPVEVAEVVADVTRSFAPRLGRKGLTITTSIADEVPPWVVTDRTRVRQILLNLVGNAVKFTERGEIAVAVTARSLGERRHRLRLEVRDSGIGVERDRLGRLFEPFAQVDASTTRRFGGTGLGLAICRRLVEAMDGEIGVESQPGAGSTFWFTVPVERAAPDRPEAAPTPRPAPLEGLADLRILIAEDNPVSMRLAVALLEALGCADLRTVSDGAAAVEAARQEAFDLILMDVQMPELDGLDAARRIRAQLAGEAGPLIVAMTAGVLADERLACRDAGMDEFLSKPVDFAALRKVLGSALGRARAKQLH